MPKKANTEETAAPEDVAIAPAVPESENLPTGSFGWALEAVKQGKRAARSGWNGKGMFIFLLNQSELTQADLADGCYGGYLPAGVVSLLQTKAHNLDVPPVLVMYTATGSLQPGWLASQADMLSEDWVVFAE